MTRHILIILTLIQLDAAILTVLISRKINAIVIVLLFASWITTKLNHEKV